MTCDELLAEARDTVARIESWPIDAPFLGEVLTGVVHACERREALRARRVVTEAQAVAAALRKEGER